MKLLSRFAILVAFALLATRSMPAGQVSPPVTIDDLVARVRIPRVFMAPDGRQVAYITVQGLPRENLYDFAINVVRTDGRGRPVTVSNYHLSPEQLFEPDTGDIRQGVAQLVWSPDSTYLMYMAHVGTGMELRIRAIGSGSERVLLQGFQEVEISAKGGELEIKTTRATLGEGKAKRQPEDLALLVKDGYSFYGPLVNPKIHGKFVIQYWRYTWGKKVVARTNQPDIFSYLPFPEEWVDDSERLAEKKGSDSTTYYRNESASPDGKLIAMVEDSARNLNSPVHSYRTEQIVLKDSTRNQSELRVLVPSAKPRAFLSILGWDPGGKEIYYVASGPRLSLIGAVTVDGQVRKICEEESGFSLSDPAAAMSKDARTVVLVGSTNVTPDELVKIDLRSGKLTVLSSPNDNFKRKSLPKVRFVPIDCCDADFYGRLYLPIGYAQGKKYPVVFTNYISSPGFYASVGDEVPILAMVAHGMAVFAMNSSEANTLSTTGDFRLEISRVQKPLRALEWVRDKLTDDGLIDSERCGLTGLSYGSEIAMYAYWKSRAFRAVSVATTTWEPMNYVLAGVPFSKFLESRGFPVPRDGTYAKWSELSAGLNARPDLPPLLMQSPDGEEYFGNVETWLRLRKVGAPVQWYEYPNEGHVKRYPANRWWVYQRNLDWFAFWLEGYEDPDPAKAAQYKSWRELREVQEENEKKVKKPATPGTD